LIAWRRAVKIPCWGFVPLYGEAGKEMKSRMAKMGISQARMRDGRPVCMSAKVMYFVGLMTFLVMRMLMMN
jgi:hypothetical protein